MDNDEHLNRKTGLTTFTLFVILPTEDVCSLRNLTSGVTVRELRCRLELMAGIPAQIYRLVCSDDAALHEEYQLVLEHNVWDGFIVRVQLHDCWTKLYKYVMANNVDALINHGAVHCKDQKHASVEEETKFKNIMRERGFVALFLASYHGHAKMCQVLLSLCVDVNMRTPFNRTPLHAAVCRDQDKVMDLLIQHGGSTDVKDVLGDTVELIARKCFAKECVRKLRIMRLQGSNGLVSVPGSAIGGRANSKTTIKLNPPVAPHPPAAPHPSRPNTSSKTRLIKRSDGANVVAKTVPNPTGQVTTSSEYFLWDTDHAGSRIASASKFRLGLSTATEMPRLRTADAKHCVTWDDSTPRVSARHTHERHKPFQNQPSILKNKGDNWATVPPRKSASRDSAGHGLISLKVPPGAPSEDGSQLSVASAPGVGFGNMGGSSDARSVESAPDMHAQSVSGESTCSRPTSRKDATKRPRTRLLVSRHRTNESWRTMKRRIQIAESKKKLSEEERQKKRETFEEWLNRKRKQEKRDSRETDSDESGTDSETEGSNLEAFQEWLKEQRQRRIVRPQTVTVADLYRRKTRPLKGLVTVTDTPEVNVDSNENMVAHKKWREKFKSVNEHDDTEDLSTQKKLLEEKRQRLLARAVSYEEWMEHTEDRKKLMQRILQANMAELEGIEKEKHKKRTGRQISYNQWREMTEKREITEKKHEERQRAQKEEEYKLRQFRSSASVPHDVWLQRKEEEKRQKFEKEREKENVHKVKVKSDDNSSAFDKWFDKKHQKNLVEIQSQIHRERELIKVLRDRRVPSVSTC